MQLSLNCFSAGFQTSEKTTILGGRGRRGKPTILHFLLFPIHYERKFIYNYSSNPQFWLMCHFVPISIDHQYKPQRFWEGLTILK